MGDSSVAVTSVYVANLAAWLVRADEGLRGVDGISAHAIAGKAYFVGDHHTTQVRVVVCVFCR